MCNVSGTLLIMDIGVDGSNIPSAGGVGDGVTVGPMLSDCCWTLLEKGDS